MAAPASYYHGLNYLGEYSDTPSALLIDGKNGAGDLECPFAFDMDKFPSERSRKEHELFSNDVRRYGDGDEKV